MLIRYTDFSLSHALDKYLNILLNLRCTLIYRVFIIKITAIISVSKNKNSLYLKNPFELPFTWMGVSLLRGSPLEQIGSLSKPRRRRQRERHQTKGLMSRTMAMHVRYKSLYISLPSSAKQQREMTKFCVLYGTWTTTANISYFHLELHAAIAHLARARF